MTWWTLGVVVALLFGMQIGMAVEAAAPVEITWWQAWTNTDISKEFLENTIVQFQKQYPHIKVNMEYVVYNEIAPKAMVAIAGGSSPDVLMLLPQDYVSFAHAGLLRPLDDLMAKERVSLSAFLPADAAKAVYQNKVYGLPHISGGASTFLLINKTRFEESGMAPNPPTTWAELMTASKRLTQWNGDQIAKVGLAGVGFDLFLGLFSSNNGQITSPDGRKASVNSKEAVETLRYMMDLQDAMGGQAALAAFGAVHNARDSQPNYPIYTGAAAMTRGYQALFKHINSVAKDFDFGVGVIPYNQANPQASGHGFADQGWFMAVPSGIPAEKQEAAFLWVKWMTAMENGGATFPMVQGRPAPLRKVNLNKMYYETNPEWPNVIRVLETDVSPAITPVYGQVRTAVLNAASAVLGRKTSPETALEEAQRLIQQYIDEFYQKK